MMRTFCTPVRDQACFDKLDDMARVLAPVRHWAFREVHIAGRPVKDVKRDAIARFGITARTGSGLHQVGGAVAPATKSGRHA